MYVIIIDMYMYVITYMYMYMYMYNYNNCVYINIREYSSTLGQEKNGCPYISIASMIHLSQMQLKLLVTIIIVSLPSQQIPCQ